MRPGHVVKRPIVEFQLYVVVVCIRFTSTCNLRHRVGYNLFQISEEYMSRPFCNLRARDAWVVVVVYFS